MAENFGIKIFQNGALYESFETYYYIVSNNSRTSYRVLKIDRTDPTRLNIQDDKEIYNQQQIAALLKHIRQKCYEDGGTRFHHVTSTFGLLGFVKFLLGYYMIFITRRECAAAIGGHYIYAIGETKMIYIHNDRQPSYRTEEIRYVKAFQDIDLSSNFYFSYSYDITRTLQYNMTTSHVHDGVSSTYGDDHIPSWKFIWNKYLLSEVESKMHPDWILYVMHGFVAQSEISIFGRSMYVAVIARRSTQYAGTRFLKRGMNNQGHVANDVETEQIVFDASTTTLNSNRFTSYVQLRASVPAYWSQVYSGISTKPPITIDKIDPYAVAAGRHFNFCLKHYGAPVIVLNLVKKKEKKPRESLLSVEMENTIEYLNQFLPKEHRIQYLAWDMSRFTKNKDDSNAMAWLEKFADHAVRETGFFHSGPQLYYHKMRGDRLKGRLNRGYTENCCLQTGVVRVNCVDCLDRTNSAQFMIGKTMLAVQLRALGVLDDSDLQFDTPAVNLLEELYESHGDTLALQYGGSQLVHRVRSYRRVSPWSSRSKDILQSISRYYSNSFTDVDKQNSINIFLGVYKPWQETESLWQLRSDYHLHNNSEKSADSLLISCTQWIDKHVFDNLPYAYGKKYLRNLSQPAKTNESTDIFGDYYHSCIYTSFEWCWGNFLFSTLKTFAPPSEVDPHPFTVYARTKPPVNSKYKVAPRHVAGTPSPIDEKGSSDEDEKVSSDEETRILRSDTAENAHRWEKSNIRQSDVSPTKDDVYGTDLKEMLAEDRSIIEKYINIESSLNSTPLGDVSLDCRYAKLVNEDIDYIGLSSDPATLQAFENAYEISRNGATKTLAI